MLKRLRLLSIAVLSLFTLFSAPLSHAEDLPVSVNGRLEACCSTYFTTLDGLFTVTYKNNDLPWGTQVLLRYGFEVSEFSSGNLYVRSSWQELGVSEAPAIAPFVWEVKVKKTLYSRGSSSQITGLNFVMEIHLPDGQVYFEKGSDTAMGYYRAAAPSSNDACYPYNEVGCPMLVQPIRKNF